MGENILVISRRDMIAEEMENTARLLRAGVRMDSVVWRLADTAAVLVELVERSGVRDVQGIHSFSGKGGKLVRRG